MYDNIGTMTKSKKTCLDVGNTVYTIKVCVIKIC